jgi:hypothetical protein
VITNVFRGPASCVGRQLTGILRHALVLMSLPKEVDMSRALFALLVAMLTGQALAESRIDATTQATFSGWAWADQ